MSIVVGEGEMKDVQTVLFFQIGKWEIRVWMAKMLGECPASKCVASEIFSSLVQVQFYSMFKTA